MYNKLNTLSENSLNTNILQMWSNGDHNVSRFYKTGFETILFNKDLSFALKTVVESSINFENDVFIIGSGNTLELLISTAKEQNLSYYSFDCNRDNWDKFEQKMSVNSVTSHILIGIDSETTLENIPIKNLLQVVSNKRYSLIVYCNSQIEGLNDLFGGTIDYMIGKVSLEPVISFVVARRNKLVQTEGASCSFNHDLYSHWQWSMRDRKSVIEPMWI